MSKLMDGAYLSSSPPIGEDLPWQSGLLELGCWLGSRNQDWRDCCDRHIKNANLRECLSHLMTAWIICGILALDTT